MTHTGPPHDWFVAMSEATQICRGFTDEQWEVLRRRLDDNNDEAAWHCAINVFERRLRERFISSIEALQRADSGPGADREVPAGSPADCSTLPDDAGAQIVVPGFAIMALCCLLIETLQLFFEKPKRPSSPKTPVRQLWRTIKSLWKEPNPPTTELFLSFLRRPAFDGAFNDDNVAKSFLGGIRNGIFHQAETRGWVIWRSKPKGRLVEPRGDGYALNRTAFVKALSIEFDSYLQKLRDPVNQDQRGWFLKKMNRIVEKC